MQNAGTVLAVLRERGGKGLPCDELYRQMFNKDLYLLAYGNIYSNQGAMTPGADGETADGMSGEKIDQIIAAMRGERYRFAPARRVYIPKKNGKLRPLGLPSWSDKLIGEVVRLLLEAYYEPQFSGRSHGFRKGKGCHTALREIQQTWTGTVWFIEGDISDCFGGFSHEILLGILAEKIHDQRFLRLIRNMLKAGYLEDWEYHDTLSGVPQGGVVTPPTQKAISASRPRWVTGVWSGDGERRGAGGAAGVRSGRVRAAGGAGRDPGGRAGRRRDGGVGPAGREVAGGAGYLDAGDDRIVDRAVAGSGAVPVSGLAGQDAAICLLLDIICSSFMSCLGIAVRVPPSTLACQCCRGPAGGRGSGRRRRPGCWPGGWAARSGRPAVMWPGRRSRAGSRSRMRDGVHRPAAPAAGCRSPGARPGVRAHDLVGRRPGAGGVPRPCSRGPSVQVSGCGWRRSTSSPAMLPRKCQWPTASWCRSGGPGPPPGRRKEEEVTARRSTRGSPAPGRRRTKRSAPSSPRCASTR